MGHGLQGQSTNARRDYRKPASRRQNSAASRGHAAATARPEVRPGPRRGGAPRGVRWIRPGLQQVGLVDVLDRVGLLADGDGERGEPDRPAAELRADDVEDLAVEPVQALVVDLEQVERGVGGLGGDHAGGADLGVVAHALEQPVGDARRAAAALGDRARAVVVDRGARGCAPSGGRSRRGRPAP